MPSRTKRSNPFFILLIYFYLFYILRAGNAVSQTQCCIFNIGQSQTNNSLAKELVPPFGTMKTHVMVFIFKLILNSEKGCRMWFGLTFLFFGLVQKICFHLTSNMCLRLFTLVCIVIYCHRIIALLIQRSVVAFILSLPPPPPSPSTRQQFVA